MRNSVWKPIRAARGNHVIEAHPAAAVRLHVLELGAAAAERRHDVALGVAVRIDGDLLVGLVRNAVDLLDDHAGPRDRELVALAAHVLEEHAEVQLAAAVDDELVRVGRGLDAQGDVVNGLALQALADLAAGDELAFPPEERRGVDLERHADRRLIHGETRQRLDVRGVAQGIGDLGLRDAGKGDDVARLPRTPPRRG